MRELKFRIWVKDEERYYDETDEESYQIIPNGQVTYTSEAYEEDGVFYTDTTNATNNVVVEQYTGLKDKNGKEIYEGDIVKFNETICIVEFDEMYARYTLRDLSDDVVIGFDALIISPFGVIGNIHENEDLLEEEE